MPKIFYVLNTMSNTNNSENKPLIFISHSLNRIFANELEKQLYEKIPSLNFFIDVGRIDNGDKWRAEILTALRNCDGAVIILNDDACKSHWVQFETNILLWRSAFYSYSGKIMHIIPLVIGEPDLKIFEPMQLSEFQFRKIQSQNPPLKNEREIELSQYNAVAEEIVSAVSSEYQKFACHMCGDDKFGYLKLWVEKIEPLLSKSYARLRGALSEFKIAKSKIEMVDKDVLEKELPYLFIHGDALDVINAYRKIKEDPSVDLQKLFTHIEPSWIQQEAATTITRHCYSAENTKPLIVFQTSNTLNDMDSPELTAKCFLRRAFGCSRNLRILYIDLNFGENIETEFLDNLKSQLKSNGLPSDGDPERLHNFLSGVST
jgi:hypothetical protein